MATHGVVLFFVENGRVFGYMLIPNAVTYATPNLTHLATWCPKVGILVVCLKFSLNFCVPLSSPLYLGLWEVDIIGWASIWKAHYFKVNLTQVHEQMGHPVKLNYVIVSKSPFNLELLP